MLSEVSSTTSTIQLIKMMNTCIAHIDSVWLQSPERVNMPGKTEGGPAAVLGVQVGPAPPLPIPHRQLFPCDPSLPSYRVGYRAGEIAQQIKTCHPVRFDPRDPHCRKREPAPTSCPPTLHMCCGSSTHAHAHTHAHKIN